MVSIVEFMKCVTNRMDMVLMVVVVKKVLVIIIVLTEKDSKSISLSYD